MKPCVAFDICQEIYASARELVDTRLPTVQLAAASKYSWRPEMRPRLVEYVADFALAGEKALGGDRASGVANGRGRDAAPHLREARRGAMGSAMGSAAQFSAVQFSAQFSAQFLAKTGNNGASRTNGHAPLRASRLILFRMYYLGGAEYNAARRTLGIGEITWSAWTGEIRALVGRELMRRGMFPPSRYFREMSVGRKPNGRRPAVAQGSKQASLP